MCAKERDDLFVELRMERGPIEASRISANIGPRLGELCATWRQEREMGRIGHGIQFGVGRQVIRNRHAILMHNTIAARHRSPHLYRHLDS